MNNDPPRCFQNNTRRFHGSGKFLVSASIARYATCVFDIPRGGHARAILVMDLRANIWPAYTRA
jgi:hypothetical protein